MKKYLTAACIMLMGILLGAAGLHFGIAGIEKEKRMDKNEVRSRIEEHFRQRVRKDPHLRNAYLLVHSDKLGIHINIAEGSTGTGPADPRQPYFIASVGKIFTAVLTGILVEKELLAYEDPIVKYLDPALVSGLHVYKGKDYSSDIRVKHLLGHTSGLPDYFEEKPKRGAPMIDLLLAEPSRLRMPQEVIGWSKEQLEPHFPPGEGFYYSDTGYHLLGLIIERITGMPFHQALREYIFGPLHMEDSYLIQYSEPANKSAYPLAGVYVNDTDIVNYRSLGIDYAGGGIVTTSEDLLRFMRALVKNELITKTTFGEMQDWHGFSAGIDYGYGIMSFRPIPLLLPSKYCIWGNAGSTGSFLFYNPAMDVYFAGSLNCFRYHSKGIRMLFPVLRMLSKCE